MFARYRQERVVASPLEVYRLALRVLARGDREMPDWSVPQKDRLSIEGRRLSLVVSSSVGGQ